MAKPFVKWAGGKTQLLDRIKALAPEDYSLLMEPFGGGGAVSLSQDKLFRLSDSNEQLINAYRCVERHPRQVIERVQHLDANLAARGGDAYYATRDRYNKDDSASPVEQAAMFIFLNKHCFNGLYRVNRKGEFNVPWNRSTGPSLNPDDLMETHRKLAERAIIEHEDFEEALSKPHPSQCFFFIDSPYAPLEKGSFDAYTPGGFTTQQHEKLAELLNNQPWAKIMVCNHDTPMVRELYKDWDFTPVDVRRSVSSNPNTRKGKEVIIRNYG